MTRKKPTRLGWKIKRSVLARTMARRDIRFDNFYQNENVAVFPAIGVIVNRIKKSGNTSVVAFLDELERQVAGDQVTPKNAEDIKNRRRIHLQDPFTILRMHSFATLVAVRNPYHRSISGFLEKIALGKALHYRDFPSFGENSPEAFEVFLKSLKQNHFFGDRHFFPQTALMFQPKEHYTKVARLETLVHDMGAFLDQIGQDPTRAAALKQPHKLERDQIGKIQNSTSKEHYLTSRAVELIEDLYHSDFEVLGYEKR